ncbi:hypothetical protein AB1I63_02465 [Streptococcus pneumoniae]
MRNQNHLQSGRKFSNNILSRGKIVDISFDKRECYFILFIRNGAGRKHTYLKFYYHQNNTKLQKGQTVSVAGHIENRTSNQQIKYFTADFIKHEKTELASYFNRDETDFGFAYQKSYAKFFIRGKIVSIKHKYNSDWIELIVQDYCDNLIQVQYSKKMRTAQSIYQIDDHVGIYALPISSQKIHNGEIILH